MEFGATIKDVITKKTIVLFAIFIMATLVIVGGAQQAEGALVAEYHMDEGFGETTSDASGNGYNLYLGTNGFSPDSGDPTWNVTGISTSALTFDGNDVISSFFPGTGINFDAQAEATIETWINIIKPNTKDVILVAGKNTTASPYNLTIDAAGLVNFEIIDNSSNLITVSSTHPVPPHTWHHIVATYNSSSIALYIDGNLNNSAPSAGETIVDSQSSMDSYIGGDYSANHSFNVTIDEVRIFSHSMNETEVLASYNRFIPTPVHNLDMGTHHTTIQKAIDNATPGDRISVDPGTYNESVNITIPLELIGTDASNTTIDKIGLSTAINITGDFVDISGFTIKNATTGIHLDTNVNNCSIFNNTFESISDHNIEIMPGATVNGIYNNTISGGEHGIHLSNAASYIIIDDNTIMGTNTAGIYEENMGPAACNNTFSNNTLDGTGSYGIFLDETHDNIIENNWINDTVEGIYLFQNTYDNTIVGNTIMNCTTGVNLALATTNSNLIYGNNFITNTVHAVDAGTTNRWNETYANGAGNYWDTYAGADDGSGSGFHALFGDNIGDTFLPHPGAGFDEYPWTAIDGSTLPQDTVAPMVTINLPLDSVFYAGTISINATINDTEGNGVPATYQYNIDGGAWQNLVLDSGDWYIATNDTTYLTDGVHTINFRASDSIGHTNNTESVTIFVDNTPATTWLELTGPTYMMEEMMDTNLTVTGVTQNVLPLVAPLVIPQIFGPDLTIAPGTFMLYQEMTLSGVTSGTTDPGTVNMVARSTLVWQPAHPLEGKGFTSGMIEWTNLGGTGWFNGTFASEHNMFVSIHGMMYASGEGIYLGDHFEGEFNGLQSPDYAFLNISMQFHMGAWIRDTTTVTVNATDLADTIPYSGGVQIHYNTWNESMGWSGWTIGAVDTPVPVMFSDEGTKYLNWYTTDANGTQGVTHNQTYIVDNTAPTTTAEIGEPLIPGSGGMIEYLNESFDIPVPWPPAVWGITGPGWSWAPTNFAVGTTPGEAHGASFGFPDQLITPPINTLGSTSLTLEFESLWFPAGFSSAIWITDGTLPPVPIEPPNIFPGVPEHRSIDISGFIGPGTQVFFDVGVFEEWYIDDIIIIGDGGTSTPWINRTTPIYLNSTDGGAIPVGTYNITYNIWNTTTGWQGLTTGAGDTNLTLSGFDEDSYFIEFYTTDALGNTEMTQNISFIVDNTAPITTIEFGEPKQGANPVNISSTTMLYLNSTESGIGDYNITYRAWNASAGWTAWTFGVLNTNISLTNYDEGLNFIEYYATDILGNKENTHNETFVVDNTDPTTTLIFGTPQQGSNPINITSATPIYLNATDGPFGSYNITYRVWNESTGWSVWTIGATDTNLTPNANEEGTHYIEFYATDIMGNVETLQNETFVVDDTSPSTTLVFGVPQQGLNPVNITSSTMIYLNSTDGGLAPVGGYNITYNIWNTTTGWQGLTTGADNTNLTLTGFDEDNYHIEFYATDALGNTETTQNISFTVDNTAPTTTYNVGTPFYGPNHLKNTTEIELIVNDGIGVGVNATYFRIWNSTSDWTTWTVFTANFTLEGTDGTRYLEFYSDDLLGNKEIVNNYTFFVDHTGPVITINSPLPMEQFRGPMPINATFIDQIGNASTYMFQIDGGAWIPLILDSGDWYNGTNNTNYLSYGNHELNITGMDELGNVFSVNVTFLGRLSVQNVDTGNDYYTLQEAIDNATSGDTLIVAPGTYPENIFINKTINIVNSSFILAGDIVIDPSGSLHFDNVSINTQNLTIDGPLTLDNSPNTLKSWNVWINAMYWVNGSSWEMNNTYDGQYNITVNGTGGMIIQSNSTIRSATTFSYMFTIESGATFRVENSTVRDAGWDGSNIGLVVMTDNAYLFNATLTNNFNGISIVNADYARIDNSTIYRNDASGVYIEDGNYTKIYYSNISDGYTGVNIDNGSYNEVYYSNISYNTKDGIYINNGIENIINYTSVFNNSNNGISLDDTNKSYVYNSNVYNNTNNGIYVYQSDNIEVIYTNITYNDGDGVYLEESYLIYANNNTVINNTGHGIYLYYSYDVEIYTNNVSSNEENGIMLDESNNNTDVVDNYVYDNNMAGIELRDDNSFNYIFNNTIVNNSRDGSPPGIGLYENNYNNTIEQNIISGNGRRGIGIGFDNYYNVITNNTITDNIDDGVGFINGNWDNTIEYNTITDNGGTGVQLTTYNDGNYIVNNKEISNNTEDGIYIYRGSFNTIENNKIWDNQQYGIYVSGQNLANSADNNEIINNTIVGSAWSGIEIGNGYLFNIADNTIDNSTNYGIYAWRVTGDMNWTDNSISNAPVGIYAGRSTFVIENCTLFNITSDDIVLSTNSHIISLNSTFDKSSVVYNDANSDLTLKWYMHPLVLTTSSTFAYNAQVDAWNNTDTLHHTGATDMTGYIHWWIVTEYIENQAGQTSHNPQKVEATDGLYYDLRYFNVDQSMTVTLWLNQTYPPTVALVATGIQYDATEAEYDMLIALTQNGLILVHEWDTEVLVTIYDQDMNVVVNADNASVENGTLGLYSYNGSINGSMMIPGTYFVFIDANVSGLHSSAITSFEIVDWIQTINNVNATTLAIEANLAAFYADFNSTWTAWNTSFAAYWTDLNATTDGLNITIQAETMALSNQMTGYEANITALLSDISGNISQIDSNLTALDMSMQSYFQTMWNEHNTSQALVSAYWGNWNTTIATLQSTMDFVNTTTLSVEAVLGEFAMDFENFWNNYNSTTSSDLADIYSWFNTTWNLAEGTEANITALLDALSAQMNTFEGNLTAMLNTQNVMMSDFETNMTNILAAHDAFLAQVDANITALDATVAAYYLDLLTENNDTQATISSYWANWNNSITALQDDVDYVNASLLSHIASFGAYWTDFNTTWTNWESMFLVYWADYNTTWTNWNTKFDSYWTYFNSTTQGLNITVQDQISDVHQHMTGFEANITLLLADLDGDVSSVDANLTSMDATMQSYFQSMWNEHNSTQSLVGIYWTDWNATIAQLNITLEKVSLTTLAINTSLTTFLSDFANYWTQFNGNMTEIAMWFNDTWTISDMFEANMTAHLDQQDLDIASMNSDLDAMDALMQQSFMNVYENHTTDRTVFSSYWMDWNNTIDAMQMDVDFLNTTLQRVDLNLTIMNDTMVALLSALDAKIDAVNASLEATLSSIETNLLSELNMMQSTFLSELAIVNLTLYNEIQSGILSITVDIAGLNASLAQELMDLGDDLTDQHDALEAWLDTAVTGIQDRIDELEQELLDQLDALNNSLASHDTDVSAQMDDIEQTLIDLRKLDIILGDLVALDTSLDRAEDELTSSLQAHEDKMKSRDNLVLILLLITLIIALVSLFAARKWHSQNQDNWSNVSVMEDDELEYADDEEVEYEEEAVEEEEGEVVDEEFFEE